MKQPIRFFSIGLLSSAIIMLGFNFFDNSSKESIENVPVDELITKVEEDGYRVITDDEFISYSFFVEQEKQEQASKEDDNKQKDKAEDKDEKDKDKEKEKQEKADKDKKDTKKAEKEEAEDDKEKVIKAKFTTKSGVVSQDIADILVEKKIIKDSKKFAKYLEDNDYSPYIQLGTFEVNSDMSFKELAETVTTYPGD
ncbi:hypothetical protein SPD48_14030 [Pseudogracilibacillus sp. SE30717A]|uniref:hypothetical protein n=1 Tax=Pseudogracilibacillus sp. SE30717A TaxID=3098293 RepID=UPI00300E5EB0